MRSLDLREDRRFATFFAAGALVVFRTFVEALAVVLLRATFFAAAFLFGFVAARFTLAEPLPVVFVAAFVVVALLAFDFSDFFEDSDLFTSLTLPLASRAAPVTLAVFFGEDALDNLSRFFGAFF